MQEEDLRRLTVAELKIAEHEKKHDSVQESLARLAEGITALVQAEIRRESDLATFNRLGTSVHELSLRIEALSLRLNNMQELQLRKELHAYKNAVLKIINWAVGISGAAAAAYITWHFGWKSP